MLVQVPFFPFLNLITPANKTLIEPPILLPESRTAYHFAYLAPIDIAFFDKFMAIWIVLYVFQHF